MATASKATGFLTEQARANLEDVILLLDTQLKSISVAAAVGGIEVAAWNWSDVAAAFARIIRGNTATGDEEMASGALRDGGKEVERAVYKAGESLKKLHEIGAGNRLEEIVKMAEKKPEG